MLFQTPDHILIQIIIFFRVTWCDCIDRTCNSYACPLAQLNGLNSAYVFYSKQKS